MQKRCSKRGLLKFFGPILGFYTKNSPQNSWSPHFRITIWYQKSRNVGTSCIKTCILKHLIQYIKMVCFCLQVPKILLVEKICIQKKICSCPLKYKCSTNPLTTGGPHISWFLVPNGNHEMRGSWIPRTVFSVKPQNGSKSFLKSTFWAFFSWNFNFSPIEIAAFSSLLFYAY